MPELPEAERGRAQAERALRGRRIERVRVADDRIVFAGVHPRMFARAVKGRTVHRAHRYGKYIWLELDRAPHPVFHFGMTGFFRHYHDPGERPRFTKVELALDDGSFFAMSNARRLGRIRLVTDPMHEPPLTRLGFDPLLGLPSRKEFHELLTKRRAVLKGVLLDQAFAAGIGNWIADEVLFQSGISPLRFAHTLTERESNRLRAKLRWVVTRAVAVDADATRFPASWIFHHRWRDGRGRGRRVKAAFGAIRFSKVAGRSTAWVPSRQG